MYGNQFHVAIFLRRHPVSGYVHPRSLCLKMLEKKKEKKKRIIMASLNDYFGSFWLSLKIAVFQCEERFFKVALCPGWNVAISFRPSLIWEKGRQYWSFF